MPAPPLPALPRDTWSWLEVRSGVARVVAATADHFVPQMLNLELVGGVDFRKGCYPGQEVVARSQYRGTLKRRTVMVEASGPLAPGAEVFHPSDPSQPAGEVVLAAPGPQGEWSALVEVKRSMLDDGLNFRSEGVDMRVVELPYALPADSP
jgi:folate-binding protein YgfZ